MHALNTSVSTTAEGNIMASVNSEKLHVFNNDVRYCSERVYKSVIFPPIGTYYYAVLATVNTVWKGKRTTSILI